MLVACALVAPLVLPRPAGAICRVVQPSSDSGRAPVAFDAATDAFFVVSPEVIVDWECPPEPEIDAGVLEDDAGIATDDGGALESDAGVPDDGGALEIDAGTASDDAGIDGGGAGGEDSADAGVGLDADTLDGATADGGGAPRCWDGSFAVPVGGPVVSLVVQPRVLATGGSSGLIMPVPARPDVAPGPRDLFDVLALQELRASGGATVHETVIVEETESLGFQCTDPHYSTDARTWDDLAASSLMLGCGADGASSYYRPGTERRDAAIVSYGDAGTVTYEDIPVGSDYDVTVISASSIDALSAWMDEHGFAHSSVDDEAFAHYVGEGSWFLALDVHPEAGNLEQRPLEPLVVTWRGETVPVTHRLQFDPAGGTLVTNAWVMAPTRVDASDESALTLSASPTTLSGALAGFGLRAGWLTRLAIARQQREDIPDAQMISVPAGEIVAPSDTIERTTRVQIPLACCAGGGVAPRQPGRTFTHERTYVDDGTGVAPPIPEEWFRSPEWSSSEPFCADPYGGSSALGFGCGGSSSSSSSSSTPPRTLRGCSVAARPVSALLGCAVSPFRQDSFAHGIRGCRARTS